MDASAGNRDMSRLMPLGVARSSPPSAGSNHFLMSMMCRPPYSSSATRSLSLAFNCSRPTTVAGDCVVKGRVMGALAVPRAELRTCEEPGYSFVDYHCGERRPNRRGQGEFGKATDSYCERLPAGLNSA